MIEMIEEPGLPGTDIAYVPPPPPAPVVVATIPAKEPGCWDRIKVIIYRLTFVYLFKF